MKIHARVYYYNPSIFSISFLYFSFCSSWLFSSRFIFISDTISELSKHHQSKPKQYKTIQFSQLQTETQLSTPIATKVVWNQFQTTFVFSHYLNQSADLVILVGKLFFHTLAAFLRLYGKCGSRTGKETFETDGLASIRAKAVLAFIDAADGCLYFA